MAETTTAADEEFGLRWCRTARIGSGKQAVVQNSCPT
jgi:hypothetical protein